MNASRFGSFRLHVHSLVALIALVTNIVLASIPASATPISAPLFGSATVYYDVVVGGGLWSATIADFDADGVPDVATTSNKLYQGTISVFLGRGDGSFRERNDYSVPQHPTSIVAADLNGDGHLDLAASNESAAVLHVLLGAGDGTFAPVPGDILSTGSTTGIRAADFDGDGIVDLAAVGFCCPDRLLTYRGHGDGTFASPTAYNLPSNSAHLAIADLNQDGVPDVLVQVGNTANQLRAYLGNGDGSLAAPVIFSATGMLLAIGDWNGDHRTDAIVSGSGPTQLFLGSAVGVFNPPISIALPYPVADLQGADVDGDGNDDLVVERTFQNEVLCYRGRGDGTFLSPISTPVATEPRGAEIADLNGDGRADILPLGFDALEVAMGKGDGTFGAVPQVLMESEPRGVGLGDVDGDGNLDLATANRQSNNVSLRLGAGTGAFGPATSFGVSQHPIVVAIADVDLDGRADMVSAGDNGQASVLIGLGGGDFAPAATYTTGQSLPVAIDVLDMNGDGVRDLVVTGDTTMSVVGGIAPGVFQGFATQYLAGPFPTAMRVGELSGDALPDFAASNFWHCCFMSGTQCVCDVQGKSSFYTNQGAGGFSGPTALGSGVGTFSGIDVEIADCNGDGRADAVGFDSDAVRTYLKNPGGGFASAVTSSVPIASDRMAIGDANVDGNVDFIVDDGHGARVVLGNGAGSFQTQLRYGYGGAGTRPAIGDLDHDGYPDLVVALPSRNVVSVMRRQRGPLGVGPETPKYADLALVGPCPNPATYSATVGFTLPSAAAATLELLDIAGRAVESHDVGAMGAGSHAVRLGDHARLAPGVYVIRLTQTGRSVGRKVAVIR